MKSLKILIVEDELITATSIQETLEAAGHEIVGIARNLRETLVSLKHATPDLALVDITLEGTTDSGIAIARQMQILNPMPIIYLTAHSEPDKVAEAQKTHPAAYLLKPFRQKELAIQVELAYYNHYANQESAVDPRNAANLYLPVEGGKRYVRVEKKEVLYLKAAGAYVEVHTLKEPKKQLFSMNLSYLFQFFENQGFYRLSRSLVVNLDHIEHIEKGQLFLTTGETVLSFPEPQYKDLLKKLAIVRTA